MSDFTPEFAAAMHEIEQVIAKNAHIIGPKIDIDGDLNEESGEPHPGATPGAVVVLVEWDLLPVDGETTEPESREWLSYHHSTHLRRSQIIGMLTETLDEFRCISRE